MRGVVARRRPERRSGGRAVRGERSRVSQLPRSAPALSAVGLSIGFVAVAALASAQPALPPRSARIGPGGVPARLTLRRIHVQCRERAPSACALPPETDLAILYFSVRNLGSEPYQDMIDGLSLVSRGPERWFEARTPRDCAPEPAGPEVDPILPSRSRRLRAVFALPRGVVPERVLYHDDDFPTCLMAPRVTYSSRTCRAPDRPARAMSCQYFDR